MEKNKFLFLKISKIPKVPSSEHSHTAQRRNFQIYKFAHGSFFRLANLHHQQILTSIARSEPKVAKHLPSLCLEVEEVRCWIVGVVLVETTCQNNSQLPRRSIIHIGTRKYACGLEYFYLR